MTYAIFTATFTDPASFAAYGKTGGEALAKHGGTLAGKARPPELLDGAGPAPDIAVLLSFPDRAAAEAWINDPDYAEVHALRRASGTTSVILLE